MSGRPARYAPSRQRGACLLLDEADEGIIKEWLKLHSVNAIQFGPDEIAEFIGLIEGGVVEWCVLASNERGVFGSHFQRLFRALVSTDTELWTAKDNRCLSDELFSIFLGIDTIMERSKHLFDDYESFGPVQDPEPMTLDCIYEALLASRRQQTVELLVGRLSPTELELFEAASDHEPLTGENITARTLLHHHDAATKRALSHLVKHALMKKLRAGYLRSAESHH